MRRLYYGCNLCVSVVTRWGAAFQRVSRADMFLTLGSLGLSQADHHAGAYDDAESMPMRMVICKLVALQAGVMEMGQDGIQPLMQP
jgi:hypothetical protein